MENIEELKKKAESLKKEINQKGLELTNVINDIQNSELFGKINSSTFLKKEEVKFDGLTFTYIKKTGEIEAYDDAGYYNIPCELVSYTMKGDEITDCHYFTNTYSSGIIFQTLDEWKESSEAEFNDTKKLIRNFIEHNID